MRIEIIEPKFIDFAWRDGANELGKACDLVDEITESQLKMILARGERYLARLVRNEETAGWATFRIDQLPNMRVLFITDLVTKRFDEFFPQVKLLAESLGCSRIRCSAHDSQARLYRIKAGFTPVYTTLEVAL